MSFESSDRRTVTLALFQPRSRIKGSVSRLSQVELNCFSSRITRWLESSRLIPAVVLYWRPKGRMPVMPVPYVQPSEEFKVRPEGPAPALFCRALADCCCLRSKL